MRRRLSLTAVGAACALAFAVMVGQPAGTAAPVREASSVAQSAGSVAQTAARPKATISAKAVKLRSGWVRVTARSNARYVKVKYTTRNGRVKVRKLRVRSSQVAVALAPGTRSIRVRAMATKRLRATSWRAVPITTAQPIVKPTPKPTVRPTPTPTATPTPTPTPTATPTPTPTSSGEPGLRVVGNQLVDASGRTAVLHGVNRSGSEYACIQGWGFFEGPVDQSSIDAMKRWGINAVRVPLNSACWLDIENQFASYNPAFAGAAYQHAIEQYVDLLTANGMYTILDLQWTGCGDSSCYADWLKPMPDRPYATQFWGSVAGSFASNHSVLFDLFNEPQGFDDWSCWRDGGCTAFAGGSNEFTMEGMQPMVDAVRAAGATTQPIMLGGLSYANNMTGWMANLPTDPSNSLVASIHLYDFNWPCPTVVAGRESAADAITCFTNSQYNSIEALAAEHPVVFGELGQDGCATDFVDPMLTWIGERGFSVLGWAWNTQDCSTFPALISDYDGTPTTLGAAFQQFFTATSER